MEAKKVLALLAAAALLAACSIFGNQGATAQDGPCNQGVCKVGVTVQDCARGALTADPDTIKVPAPNNIEWSMETDGFEFRDDSIVINGTGFPKNPGVNGNGKKYKVHDDWTDRRPDIKYSIQVWRKSDGVKCGLFDPRISNM